MDLRRSRRLSVHRRGDRTVLTEYEERVMDMSCTPSTPLPEHRHIILRAATERDAEVLLSIYAPYVAHTAVTFEYRIPSMEEFSARIRHVREKYPWLVAEADGKILGYAYADAFHGRAAYGWAAELSVYVAPDRKRLGIGARLYEALEILLKEQGFLNLYACIAFPEKEDEYLTGDSVKFHEKLGFQVVGKFHRCAYKFNRWYHMVWMEKHIGLHAENPPPVRSFQEMTSMAAGILKKAGGPVSHLPE